MAGLITAPILRGVLLSLSALFVACGGDDRLSPADYITAYCEIAGSQIGPDVDAETLGEARRELMETAESLEVIVPPREFETYHVALVEFLRIYASALGESGDDQDRFPEELEVSGEIDRRMAITYARMTLEFVSLPQPFIDRIRDCE